MIIEYSITFLTEKLNSLEIYQKVAFEFKDGWNGLVYELGKDIN